MFLTSRSRLWSLQGAAARSCWRAKKWWRRVTLLILLSGLCLIMDLHESSNQMRIWFDDSSNQLSWNPLKLDRQHQYDHLLAGAYTQAVGD